MEFCSAFIAKLWIWGVFISAGARFGVMIKQTIFYSRRIGFNCGADIFREFIDYGCVLIFDKASDILAKRKNGNANANRSTGQTNKSEREKVAFKIAEM